MKKDIGAVDEYIARFPQKVQVELQKVRRAIKNAAPKSEETISYGMPAFRLHTNLVYFAAWKDHIGFYPTSSAIKVFAQDLEKYTISKGTIQLPFGKPIPTGLIKRIVKYRVQQNLAKVKKKNKK